MNAKPLEPGRSYFIKHTSHQVRGVIRVIHHRLDVNTLEHVEAQRLELNEIGEISVEEVIDLEPDQIQPAPRIGTQI